MQRYEITGMSCAACASHVEKAVSAVPGVAGVAVSLLTNSMQVDYIPDADPDTTARRICNAVEAAGYGASLATAESENAELEDTETPKLKKRLIASLLAVTLATTPLVSHPADLNAEMQAMFNGLAENEVAGIYMLDEKLDIIYANEQLARMTGHPRETLAGGFALARLFPPEGYVEVRRRVLERLHGLVHSARYERSLLRADASAVAFRSIRSRTGCAASASAANCALAAAKSPAAASLASLASTSSLCHASPNPAS